jgi:hypothetical protein
MNIFYLSHKPSRCARWHCDKHVVKMILETAQLLYTAHWVLSITPDFTTAPYRVKTHEPGYLSIKNKKHPCAVWVRESLDNYVWLCQLGIALCKFPPPELQPTGWTLPPMAMPEEYRNKNPLIAYRAYYRVGKKHILTYTKRSRPHWLSHDIAL